MREQIKKKGKLQAYSYPRASSTMQNSMLGKSLFLKFKFFQAQNRQDRTTHLAHWENREKENFCQNRVTINDVCFEARHCSGLNKQVAPKTICSTLSLFIPSFSTFLALLGRLVARGRAKAQWQQHAHTFSHLSNTYTDAERHNYTPLLKSKSVFCPLDLLHDSFSTSFDLVKQYRLVLSCHVGYIRYTSILHCWPLSEFYGLLYFRDMSPNCLVRSSVFYLYIFMIYNFSTYILPEL